MANVIPLAGIDIRNHAEVIDNAPARILPLYVFSTAIFPGRNRGEASGYLRHLMRGAGLCEYFRGKAI